MSVLTRSVAIALIALLSTTAYAYSPTIVRAILTPNAVADSYNMLEGASLTVAAPGVLSDDDDGDGGAPGTNISAALVDAPSIPGAFSLGNDGSISFTPTDSEFNGPVTFTYTVTDIDDGLTSMPATVTIIVDAVNDAPIAADQHIETVENVATSSVLSVTDVDSSTFTYNIVTPPTSGSVSIDTNGTFTYTPNSGFTGTDSFQWEAFDGAASSSPASTTITVVAAPPPEIGISFIVVSTNGVVATTTDTALFDGATTTGATTTTTVGSHTITPIALSGYTTTVGGDCAADGTITLAGGDIKHCVITHTQQGSPAGGSGTAEEKRPANGPISDTGPFFGSISNFSGLVLGASTTTATSSLPELPAGCTPILTGFFRKERMENDSDQVKKLQQFLNETIEANLPLTGEFGPGTDAAVKRFQTKFAEQILAPWGITSPTGFVYLTTQRWINLMSCSTLDIPMPKLVPYRG